MNMNPQQMIQLLTAMQVLSGNATPQPQSQPQPSQSDRQTLRFRRIVSVFKNKDGKWRVGIGDIVAPWTGAARAIKVSDCSKEAEYYRTTNEWEVEVAVSPFGRCNIVKATNTGVAYTPAGEFDAEEKEEFDSESGACPDEKETL